MIVLYGYIVVGGGRSREQAALADGKKQEKLYKWS